MTLLSLLADTGQTFWMPPQASTVAAETDRVFYYIYWCCLFFFVLTNGVMFAFMIRYRRRSHNDEVGHITHSTPLEILWSVIPGILLVPMFWWGFKGFVEQRQVPAGAMDIRVDATQWNWTFIYPNGLDDPDLHVPVNKPVRLVMTSQDVLHSLFIAAFRVKRDIVPKRYAELWFTPTIPGDYPLVCAEYCGQKHSDMKARCIVHPSTATATEVTYDQWLETANPLANPAFTEELKAEWEAASKAGDAALQAFIDKYKNDPVLGPIVKKLKTLAMMGKELYEKRKGCIQCHSIDGRGTAEGFLGPTWKGLYRKQETLTDGSKVEANPEYLRESMKDPNKKIVAPYAPGVMPVPRLNEKEIDCLIAYIETLK